MTQNVLPNAGVGMLRSSTGSSLCLGSILDPSMGRKCGFRIFNTIQNLFLNYIFWSTSLIFCCCNFNFSYLIANLMFLSIGIYDCCRKSFAEILYRYLQHRAEVIFPMTLKSRVVFVFTKCKAVF